jgi:hypothetical protein
MNAIAKQTRKATPMIAPMPSARVGLSIVETISNPKIGRKTASTIR